MRHRIISFSLQETMTVVRCDVYHMSAVSGLTSTLYDRCPAHVTVISARQKSWACLGIQYM